jgi:ATP-binding cassette subfamily F protein uup
LKVCPAKWRRLRPEQLELSKRLENPAIYQTDPVAAQKSAERLALIDDELISLLERWEVLEAKAGSKPLETKRAPPDS